MEWQPIETAPKDGTLFLGAGKLNDRNPWQRFICFYNGEKFWAIFSIAEGGEAHPLDGKNIPTHWQPLPKPPQGEI